MNIGLVASLLLMLGFAPTVHAQSCRIGSGPDFGDGIPYCSEEPEVDSETSQITGAPQWARRWGAIAIDPKVAVGGIGVASDMGSRASAENTAMEMCRNTGGGETCRIQISYDNQCAVIAWGDHYFQTANAPTLDDAVGLALGGCERQTNHCKIFYASCSYPARQS